MKSKRYATQLSVDRQVSLFTFEKCRDVPRARWRKHVDCSRTIVVNNRVVAICNCVCHREGERHG